LLTITGTPGAGAAPLAGQQPPAGQGAAALVMPLDPASPAPSHCGTPMEWTSPAPVLDAMPAYTFDVGSGSADLPPVWRCSCGFQLDGIVHTSNALAALS
jgi:hypothetical protein